MFCKNCGKEIDDDSKFCQYCGTNVGQLPDENQKTSSNDSNISKTENKSSNSFNYKKFIIFTLALPLAIFLCYLLYKGFMNQTVHESVRCYTINNYCYVEKKIFKSKDSMVINKFLIDDIEGAWCSTATGRKKINTRSSCYLNIRQKDRVHIGNFKSYRDCYDYAMVIQGKIEDGNYDYITLYDHVTNMKWSYIVFGYALLFLFVCIAYIISNIIGCFKDTNKITESIKDFIWILFGLLFFSPIYVPLLRIRIVRIILGIIVVIFLIFCFIAYIYSIFDKGNKE